MNWHTITVSMLDSVQSTDPRTVTLGAWAQATKRSNLDTPKKQRPALMPHGHFVGGRSARHCNQESGIVQFDIDLKDNPKLDRDQVKCRCAQLPEVYFCANSATGGMWGIARRAADLEDQLHWLEHALGVRLDKANSRSVAALRFASYDPNPYEHIRQTAGEHPARPQR
jgi:hypothetical protein|tara:strand:+ start:98 stop:604 length:507 start_codon:yes stop_codon:yes gene_type:complete